MNALTLPRPGVPESWGRPKLRAVLLDTQTENADLKARLARTERALQKARELDPSAQTRIERLHADLAKLEQHNQVLVAQALSTAHMDRTHARTVERLNLQIASLLQAIRSGEARQLNEAVAQGRRAQLACEAQIRLSERRREFVDADVLAVAAEALEAQAGHDAMAALVRVRKEIKRRRAEVSHDA